MQKEAEFLVQGLSPQERARLQEAIKNPLLMQRLLEESAGSESYQIILSFFSVSTEEQASPGSKLFISMLTAELAETEGIRNLLPELLVEIIALLPTKSEVALIKASKDSLFIRPTEQNFVLSDAKQVLMYAMAGNPIAIKAWIEKRKGALSKKNKNEDQIKTYIGNVMLTLAPGVEMVEATSSHAPIIIRDWAAISPLAFAFWAGDLELVKIILSEIPDILLEKALLQLKQMKERGHEKHHNVLAPLLGLSELLNRIYLNSLPKSFTQQLSLLSSYQKNLPIIALQWMHVLYQDSYLNISDFPSLADQFRQLDTSRLKNTTSIYALRDALMTASPPSLFGDNGRGRLQLVSIDAYAKRFSVGDILKLQKNLKGLIGRLNSAYDQIIIQLEQRVVASKLLPR